MRKLAGLIISLTLLLQPVTAFSKEKVNVYRQHAIYLYRSIDYIQWPELVYTDNVKTIKICIVGRDTLGKDIDEVATKASQIGQVKIDVKRNAENDLTGCNFLYISKSEAGNYTQYLSQVASMPVVTVSEITGFAKKGGIIEYVIKDDNLNFIVNNRQAKAQNIKIPGEFLENSMEVLQ